MNVFLLWLLLVETPHFLITNFCAVFFLSNLNVNSYLINSARVTRCKVACQTFQQQFLETMEVGSV